MARGKRRNCLFCGQPIVARYRPFCSAACADRDLGHWLSGSYAIPASAGFDDGAEDLARSAVASHGDDDEPAGD